MVIEPMSEHLDWSMEHDVLMVNQLWNVKLCVVLLSIFLVILNMILFTEEQLISVYFLSYLY